MARILVIDDNPLMLSAVRNKLTELGHGVATAANGAEALKLIRADPTLELMITDLVMPEVEGLELTRIVHRERPDLRIIAMSGDMFAYTAWPNLQAAGFLGAAAVLEKPFSAEQLEAAVAGALAR